MTKRIKLLHLTYDMRIGGTETVIKNLVEGLDKDNFDVEILCIEPSIGPFGQQLIDEGYKVSHLNWTGGFDIKVIKDIRKYIRSQNVDILHCHQYTPWVYGALASAFTTAKVIFTEHGRFYPDSSSWKRKFINPILVGLTDHITAISKATKQALVDYEFIPEDKIQVIYNGIKPLVADEKKIEELRDELNIPKGAQILGTVARLDPIKNQTMMIEAFDMVLREHPNTYLLIVGDGEEKEKLLKLVEKLAINEKVIFTGYIAKPVNHIALMDIFLLSSLSEGTSMTLLEAMSLGTPCAVTDAGGNPEVIEDKFNGFVSLNDETGEFAHNILKLLDTFNKKHWNDSCLKIFNNRFQTTKMVNQYSTHYKGVKC
ncbi:glycosyltransferase [Thalassotalea eurytherma]|uniref:Glycosyl transferase n=1 Tax=Thalassotalea eurytherma TaxID=1144278 RepID=A0ABQ6H1N9_9GAMM|nr:glycosyltransferase [Thalassotalea eurytherma]GLX82106.1 glycosyl transferase [Thalassotalea eurytherma]